MVEISTGRYLAARLKPGEDPVAGLRAMFQASGARAMAVVTCVGSLTRAVIRPANRAEATVHAGHFEILSLVGTVDPEGQHLHLSLGDGEGRVWGGHLLPGSAVYTTAEIVAVALPGLVFSREVCAVSGYRELVVSRAEGPVG